MSDTDVIVRRKNAERLHDRFCKWNHVDACAWFWEFKNGEPNWDRPEHQRWYKKAQALADAGYSVDLAIKLDKILKES